jgi:copper chaperone
MTSATYRVTGMTCEHCARAVTSEIASLGGVSSVTVELVPGGVSAVTVTSDSPRTPPAVSGARDQAGDYRLAADTDADGPHTPPSGRTLPVL